MAADATQCDIALIVESLRAFRKSTKSLEVADGQSRGIDRSDVDAFYHGMFRQMFYDSWNDEWDDMLYFVPLCPSGNGKVQPVVLRHDAQRVSELVENGEVNWEATFCVNFVFQQVEFDMLLGVCSSSEKRWQSVQVMEKNSVMAHLHSCDVSEQKDDSPLHSYPDVVFPLNKYEEVYESLRIHPGGCLVMELVGSIKDIDVQPCLLFQGSMSRHQLGAAFSKREDLSEGARGFRVLRTADGVGKAQIAIGLGAASARDDETGSSNGDGGVTHHGAVAQCAPEIAHAGGPSGGLEYADSDDEEFGQPAGAEWATSGGTAAVVGVVEGSSDEGSSNEDEQTMQFEDEIGSYAPFVPQRGAAPPPAARDDEPVTPKKEVEKRSSEVSIERDSRGALQLAFDADSLRVSRSGHPKIKPGVLITHAFGEEVASLADLKDLASGEHIVVLTIEEDVPGAGVARALGRGLSSLRLKVGAMKSAPRTSSLDGEGQGAMSPPSSPVRTPDSPRQREASPMSKWGSLKRLVSSTGDAPEQGPRASPRGSPVALLRSTLRMKARAPALPPPDAPLLASVVYMSVTWEHLVMCLLEHGPAERKQAMLSRAAIATRDAVDVGEDYIATRSQPIPGTAIYDFAGSRDDEIAGIKAGTDVLCVDNRTAAGPNWVLVRFGTNEGLVPANYLQLFPTAANLAKRSCGEVAG